MTLHRRSEKSIQDFLEGSIIDDYRVATLASALRSLPPRKKKYDLRRRLTKSLGEFDFDETALEHVVAVLAPTFPYPELAFLQEMATRVGQHSISIPLRVNYIKETLKLARANPRLLGAWEQDMTSVLKGLKVLPAPKLQTKAQIEARAEMLHQLHQQIMAWKEDHLRAAWLTYADKYFSATAYPQPPAPSAKETKGMPKKKRSGFRKWLGKYQAVIILIIGLVLLGVILYLNISHA